LSSKKRQIGSLKIWKHFCTLEAVRCTEHTKVLCDRENFDILVYTFMCDIIDSCIFLLPVCINLSDE